jgi:hypothetical protein
MDENTYKAICRICELIETCMEHTNWSDAATLVDSLAELISKIEVKSTLGQE